MDGYRWLFQAHAIALVELKVVNVPVAYCGVDHISIDLFLITSCDTLTVLSLLW